MKPHRLTLEALGPYAAETEIDFDDLTADGIFLVHGPTGAGKTFLFDAMAYALFGRGAVPGARDDSTLRSDFAGADVIPRVVFEFSVAGVRWKVERSPSDDRRVISGSNKSPRAPRALLWRLDDDGWRSISQKPTEVTTELTDIIGLGAKQFHQVMVLPQGAFEQVLRAGTGERESLLKNLFDISLFERVMTGLDARAKETKVELDKARAEQLSLAEQAGQRWTDLTGWPRPLDSDKDLMILATPDGCDLLTVALQQEHQRQVTLKAELGAELNAQQTAVLAAQNEADRWARRAHLTDTHQTLEGQANRVDLDRTRLQRSDAAETVRPDIAAAGAARSAAESASTKHRRLAARLQQALTHQHSVVENLAPIPVADTTGWVDDARTATAQRTEQLARLTELSVEATQAQAAAKEAEASVQALSRQLLTDSASDTAAQERLRALQARAEECNRATAALPEADKSAATATAAATASAALHQQRIVLDRHQRELDEVKRITLTRRETFADLRQRHLDGIAATLAAELVPGEACMVCGSCEHPHPSLATTGSTVTRDQLDQAEAAVARSQAAEADHSSRVNEQQRQVEELIAAAGPASPDPETATAKAAHARDHAKRLAALAAAAPAAAAEVQAVEERRNHLAANIATHNREIAVAKERAANQRGRTDDLVRRVTNELPAGLDIETARTHLVKIDRLLNDFADAARLVERTTEASRQCDAALTARLAAASLATEAEAVAELIDEAARQRLRHRIDTYDQQRARCLTELSSPDFANLTQECPDPEPARHAAADLDRRHTAAIEAAALLERGASEFERVARDYRATAHDCQTLAESSQVIAHLADRCSGRIDPRVSLPRWVLASYLAEICDHANQRLDTMTSGRYTLRVEQTKAKGNRQAGLELLVLDAHTGVERPVSTLSGGETFQASLALALGVADVVQTHSGGVQLDALFIDEGFGTLDGESLELAMVELDRLRQGGRVVGLISHVATLRDRIRNGIEVRPGSTGSTVRTGAVATN